MRSKFRALPRARIPLTGRSTIDSFAPATLLSVNNIACSVVSSRQSSRPRNHTARDMATQATQCALLELPGELRVAIYEHLFEDWKDHFNPEALGGTTFHSHGIMRLRVNPGTGGTLVPAWPSRRPGILLSCKQLRREAMDVLYDKTLFYYHLNRPSRDNRCNGTFLDGAVQNLHLRINIYHTRELHCAIGQLLSILEVVPHQRRHTEIRVRLDAFNSYERIRRDKTFPPEDCDQAWLALSRLLRLEFGCVPTFTLGRSWQRALGPARVEQLREKAHVVDLPGRLG